MRHSILKVTATSSRDGQSQSLQSVCLGSAPTVQCRLDCREFTAEAPHLATYRAHGGAKTSLTAVRHRQ